MKLKKQLIILGFAASILLLISCKKQLTIDTPNNIVYDTLKVAQTYNLDNDNSEPSCSLQINYVTPIKYQQKGVLEKVTSELNFNLFEDETYTKLSSQEAIDKYSTTYVENYKKDVIERFSNWRETGEEIGYFSYYKKINTEVVFDKGHILSYLISARDYKGGANASTYIQNLVFDLATGNRLFEEDIFEKGYRDKLTVIFTSEILRQNGVKTTDRLMNELGFFGIEDIPFNNNFSVDQTGITYIFNEGEIAPVSVGTITIKMEYDDILPILKKNSPIAIFFNEQ